MRDIAKDFETLYMKFVPPDVNEENTPVKYSFHKQVSICVGAALSVILTRLEHERSKNA